MNLAGKSKEELEKALATKRRGELINIIFMLASFEPMFSPQEVARRRQLSPRTVLKLVRQGRLQAHKLAPTVVRIPASALHQWDQNTKL